MYSIQLLSGGLWRILVESCVLQRFGNTDLRADLTILPLRRHLVIFHISVRTCGSEIDVENHHLASEIHAGRGPLMRILQNRCFTVIYRASLAEC